MITDRGSTATELQGVCLVNVYVPSAAERRQERDLPYLLQAIPTTMIVEGSFNYVITKTDVKGHFTTVES